MIFVLPCSWQHHLFRQKLGHKHKKNLLLNFSLLGYDDVWLTGAYEIWVTLYKHITGIHILWFKSF